MFNPQMGYQPFPYIPMPQQGQQQGVVYVPIQTGTDGKMPKTKSMLKQFKEMEEFQKLLKGDKKEEKKDDKGPEMKMSPITFFMWLWALSIPVAAVELALGLTLGRYISAMFK